MPGQQWAARVQGKKRGGGLGGALGRGFPSHCVHAAFGGPGALSPSEPLSDGAFPVPGRLGGGQGVQAREEARQPTCPGSSLQGALPWAHVAWSFPFGDGIREAGAHPKPLSSQRHSRWETEEKLGASRKVLSFGAGGVFIHGSRLDAHGNGHDPIELLLEALAGWRSGWEHGTAALAG